MRSRTSPTFVPGAIHTLFSGLPFCRVCFSYTSKETQDSVPSPYAIVSSNSARRVSHGRRFQEPVER